MRCRTPADIAFRRAEGGDDVETALKAGERIDDLQRDGLRIIQREDGFRFGTDAVLLAGAALGWHWLCGSGARILQKL